MQFTRIFVVEKSSLRWTLYKFILWKTSWILWQINAQLIPKDIQPVSADSIVCIPFYTTQATTWHERHSSAVQYKSNADVYTSITEILIVLIVPNSICRIMTWKVLHAFWFNVLTISDHWFWYRNMFSSLRVLHVSVTIRHKHVKYCLLAILSTTNLHSVFF